MKRLTFLEIAMCTLHHRKNTRDTIMMSGASKDRARPGSPPNVTR